MLLINKSASADVMKAVWLVLNTGLNTGSNAIPVYDHIPEGTKLPFVQVQAVAEQNESDKIRFGSRVTLDIDNYAMCRESKTVQTVSSRIIQLLTDNSLTVSGYDVISIELNRNECAEADADNVYVGSLTIEVWVVEQEAE